MVMMAAKALLSALGGDPVVLLRRKHPYPGFWDLPGGTVEVGEAPEAALRRELREELDVEASDIRYVGAHWFEPEISGPRRLTLIYACTSSTLPRNSDPAAHSRVSTLNSPQVQHDKLSPSALYAMNCRPPEKLLPWNSSQDLDLLLIQPFFPLGDREALSIPLGLAYLHATITAQGFAVSVLDCSLPRDYSTFCNIETIHAPVIGIQFHSTLGWDFCRRACRRTRSLSRSSLIVAGGEIASVRPWQLLEGGLVDLVVLQEGEETLSEIVTAVHDGGDPFAVKGIAYLDHGQRKVTSARAHIKVLDDLPAPSIEAFRWHDYGQWTLMSSRGCPFRCSYCSSAAFWSHTIRYHSAQWVVDQMRRLVSYGARDVYIADDTFTMNPRRVKEICALIGDEPILGWSCLTRVDRVTGDLLSAMARAGCRQISFGYESSNDRTLNLVSKRATQLQAARALDMCKDVGIRTRVSVIIGLPDETCDDVRRTINNLCELRPNEVQLYGLTPHDGTTLYSELDTVGVQILEQDPSLWTRDVLHPVCETRTLSAADIATLGQECIDALVNIGYVDLTRMDGARKIGAGFTVGTAFTPVQGIRGVAG